jgi:hypothetical protein
MLIPTTPGLALRRTKAVARSASLDFSGILSLTSAQYSRPKSARETGERPAADVPAAPFRQQGLGAPRPARNDFTGL